MIVNNILIHVSYIFPYNFIMTIMPKLDYPLILKQQGKNVNDYKLKNPITPPIQTSQGPQGPQGPQGVPGDIGFDDYRLSNALSTGILSGGFLSIELDTSKFSITAGVGLIIDNTTDPLFPTRKLVSWNSYNNMTNPYLDSIDTTYVCIDGYGQIQFFNEFPEEVLLTSNIMLGWLDHPGRIEIETAYTEPVFTPNAMSQFFDFCTVFGSFNISGNQYLPASGLQIRRTSGQTFEIGANYSIDKKSPNIISNNEENTIVFSYYYRGISGDWNSIFPVTDIDPNHWDNNSGTLANVPDGYWTIQTIMFYAPTESNDFQYGQVLYSSLESAKGAISNQVEMDPYNSYDTFRGWLIVKKGCTNLLNSNECVIISASNLGLLSVGGGSTPGPQGEQGLQGIPSGALSVKILTTGTSYVPPDGIRAIYVECIGGGGQGGGAELSSGMVSLGGGGGGGSYAASWIEGINIKNPTAYSIGIGGNGGVAGSNGNSGGDTIWDTNVIVAKGGFGGTVLPAGTTTMIQNGALGGSESSCIGDLKISGNNGGRGYRISGTSYLYSGDGADGTFGGPGGIGSINSTAGTTGANGLSYGSGGAGAATLSTAEIGGSGANGFIRISEFG